MGRPKLKPVLQEAVVLERKEQQEQEKLRKKYNLPAKKHIEIKKEHLITAITKAIGRFIRIVVILIIFFLAFTGTIAILYPEARTALIYIFNDTLRQIKEFIPI